MSNEQWALDVAVKVLTGELTTASAYHVIKDALDAAEQRGWNNAAQFVDDRGWNACAEAIRTRQGQEGKP